MITDPAEMRAAARRGEWRGSTGGQCPAHQQANLVILLKEAAAVACCPSPSRFAGPSLSPLAGRGRG